MAVEFVAAGLLASFAQLVSGKPLRFGIEAKSLVASTGAVLLQGLAESAILMRNAWRGDPETLAETGRPKKEPALLERPALVKARLGGG